MWKRWLKVILSCNLPEDVEMNEADGVSKWLVITRACVFSMTITAGLIGGLLALSQGPINWWFWAVGIVGLILAHASNNMINDYFDYQYGSDLSEDYPRGLYSPHPIHSGWLTSSQLMAGILAVNVLDLLIMIYLTAQTGWPVLVFAITGFLISVFYVAKPVKLKYRGLGELGVFLIWGPLMIGGMYYIVSQTMPAWVIAASIPYALVVTTVLMGKHIDKFEPDKKNEIRTLPVLLGTDNALFLNKILFVAFHLIVIILVLTNTLGIWVLLSLLSIPQLVRETWPKYSQPKPDTKPEGYPVWPLWYVSWAFRYTRTAGGYFIFGLIMNALIPLG